jgi:hypothetical protein
MRRKRLAIGRSSSFAHSTSSSRVDGSSTKVSFASDFAISQFSKSQPHAERFGKFHNAPQKAAWRADLSTPGALHAGSENLNFRERRGSPCVHGKSQPITD